MNNMFLILFLTSIVASVVFFILAAKDFIKGDKERSFVQLKRGGYLIVVMGFSFLGGRFVPAEQDQSLPNSHIVMPNDLTDKELDEMYKNAETLDYSSVRFGAGEETGQYVTFTGKIDDITEGGIATNILIELADADSESEDKYNSFDEKEKDQLLVQIEGFTDFVEGEEVTVYGKIFGDYTYVTDYDEQYEVPAIIADTIQSITFKESK